MSRFYTPELRAWLHGYEPVLGTLMDNKYEQAAKKGSHRQSMERMHIKVDVLKGWGHGTIAGIGVKSDPAKAGRMKKPSQL